MLERKLPVEKIPGVTRSAANAFQLLRMATVEDVLLTPPRRYEDYSRRSTLRDAKEGEAATFEIEVVSAARRPTGRRGFTVIQARVTDGTATARCDFFNQPWLLKDWKAGRRLRLAAVPVRDPQFGLHFRNPAWESADGPEVISGKILPVYRLTESIAQKAYRRVVEAVKAKEIAVDAAVDRQRRALVQAEMAGIIVTVMGKQTAGAETDEGRIRRPVGTQIGQVEAIAAKQLGRRQQALRFR
jgi:RecG-like helicase